MNTRIGNSQTVGGELIFELISLRIFAGYVGFRDDVKFTKTCVEMDATTARCKLELRFLDKQICLKCDLAHSTNPMIVVDPDGELCIDTNPNGNIERAGSFYQSKQYDRCKGAEYVVGSSCQACHTGCIHCSGAAEGQCISCNPFNKKYFALNRKTNRCEGNCDSSNGKFYDGETNTCSNCQTGCLECLSATYCTKCDASNNYFLNSGNKCNVCDLNNKKFLDTKFSNPPQCRSCMSKCLKCKDKISCDQCEAGREYDGVSQCILCDTSAGYQMVTDSLPYVCRLCHSTCKKINYSPSSTTLLR